MSNGNGKVQSDIRPVGLLTPNVVRVHLDNGMTIEAPPETWIAAILQSLPPPSIQLVINRVMAIIDQHKVGG